MSDRIRTAPDVRWMPAGVGMSMTFWCPACGGTRQTVGRRLMRFGGIRQYVCRECVAARAEATRA